MQANYVLFYTLYGAQYNGFCTKYKFFETIEEIENFLLINSSKEISYRIFKGV